MPPAHEATAFNCPFCNAYSKQSWFGVNYQGMIQVVRNLFICMCDHCSGQSIWFKEKMIYPDSQGIQPPNQDLPEHLKADYNEAASILQKSPRGAAALLRLVIQKLCQDLVAKSEGIYKDIGNLVSAGLPPKVQKALDTVRVFGNNAVHGGEMDIRDDVETVKILFGLVNFIVEKMITEDKKVDAIFDKIPENQKEAIKERDSKK